MKAKEIKENTKQRNKSRLHRVAFVYCGLLLLLLQKLALPWTSRFRDECCGAVGGRGAGVEGVGWCWCRVAMVGGGRGIGRVSIAVQGEQGR